MARAAEGDRPRNRTCRAPGQSGSSFYENFFREFEGIAPSFAVKPIAAEVRNSADIEHAIEALASEPNGVF